MDPEANCSITHPSTSIRILFPDIMTSTGLETIFFLILKNTFIKKSLGGPMTFADWNGKEMFPLGHYKCGFSS